MVFNILIYYNQGGKDLNLKYFSKIYFICKSACGQWGQGKSLGACIPEEGVRYSGARGTWIWELLSGSSRSKLERGRKSSEPC